jgi:hypothetical protein
LNAEGMLSKVQAELARLRDFDQVPPRVQHPACSAEPPAQPIVLKCVHGRGR